MEPVIPLQLEFSFPLPSSRRVAFQESYEKEPQNLIHFTLSPKQASLNKLLCSKINVLSRFIAEPRKCYKRTFYTPTALCLYMSALN